jgi:hypothetical protein
MNDFEIRGSLLEMAQLLRTQAIYLRNFHRASVALFDALAKHYPDLEKSYLENLGGPLSLPEAERLIASVDLAIQKLKDGN